MNDRRNGVHEDCTDEVVLVVSDPSSDHSDHVSPSQEANGRGTLGLCPPPVAEVVSVVSAAKTTRSVQDSGDTGSDSVVSAPSDEADEPGAPGGDSGEQLRLLALVGTDEDPYKEGGPWAYADGENRGGRVFFVKR